MFHFSCTSYIVCFWSVKPYRSPPLFCGPLRTEERISNSPPNEGQCTVQEYWSWIKKTDFHRVIKRNERKSGCVWCAVPAFSCEIFLQHANQPFKKVAATTKQENWRHTPERGRSLEWCSFSSYFFCVPEMHFRSFVCFLCGELVYSYYTRMQNGNGARNRLRLMDKDCCIFLNRTSRSCDLKKLHVRFLRDALWTIWRLWNATARSCRATNF